MTNREAAEDIKVTIDYLANTGVFDNPANTGCKEALERAVDVLTQYDGMTNGQVIQTLFSIPHIDTESHTVWVGYDDMSFTRKWWNAPYQKEMRSFLTQDSVER